VSDNTVSGIAESGAAVAGSIVLSAVSGTAETATSATIDTGLAAEVTAQTVAAPVLMTFPSLTQSTGLMTGISTDLPAAQTELAQLSVANIALSSTLINPLIDSSNPAIAAAIAAYHMVDGIFDTAWPHDGGAPPVIDYTEIRAISGIGHIKLDLTA
jgi:hypothetical protein